MQVTIETRSCARSVEIGMANDMQGVDVLRCLSARILSQAAFLRFFAESAAFWLASAA